MTTAATIPPHLPSAIAGECHITIAMACVCARAHATKARWEECLRLHKRRVGVESSWSSLQLDTGLPWKRTIPTHPPTHTQTHTPPFSSPSSHTCKSLPLQTAFVGQLNLPSCVRLIRSCRPAAPPQIGFGRMFLEGEAARRGTMSNMGLPL